MSSVVILSRFTKPLLQLSKNVLSSSKTYANPPVIPAPKLAPTDPKTVTWPPVIYSQQ